MGNIVELREKLTFGKHKGLTGAELLKSATGTKYLVWIFNNTDIEMDAFVVDQLVAHGLVERKQSRLNSNVQPYLKTQSTFKDAYAHAMRVELDTDQQEGNLVTLLRNSQSTNLADIIGKTLEVNIANDVDYVKHITVESNNDSGGLVFHHQRIDPRAMNLAKRVDKHEINALYGKHANYYFTVNEPNLPMCNEPVKRSFESWGNTSDAIRKLRDLHLKAEELELVKRPAVDIEAEFKAAIRNEIRKGVAHGYKLTLKTSEEK